MSAASFRWAVVAGVVLVAACEGKKPKRARSEPDDRPTSAVSLPFPLPPAAPRDERSATPNPSGSSRKSPFPTEPSQWKVGMTVTVSVALDPADQENVACASTVEIAGKRCEFESKRDRYPRKLTDATLLRPYSGTNGERFLAAGMWSGPEMAKGKRPARRFMVQCKLLVQGRVVSPLIRWSKVGPWNEQGEAWFAGTVSGCVVDP